MDVGGVAGMQPRSVQVLPFGRFRRCLLQLFTTS
jgi:hypothetical protein